MKNLFLIIALALLLSPVALSQATQAPDKPVVAVKVKIAQLKQPPRRSQLKRILIAILLAIMNIDKRGVVDK